MDDVRCSVVTDHPGFAPARKGDLVVYRRRESAVTYVDRSVVAAPRERWCVGLVAHALRTGRVKSVAELDAPNVKLAVWPLEPRGVAMDLLVLERSRVADLAGMVAAYRDRTTAANWATLGPLTSEDEARVFVRPFLT